MNIPPSYNQPAPPGSRPPPPPGSNPPTIGGNIVVVEGTVRKLCINTFGNKWQSRYVRVVEPTKGTLSLEYSKKKKDFDKASKKIKKATLAHPGFKEMSDAASKHHAKLKEDDNHCLEFHVQNRGGHGRALVLRYDDDEVMKRWENEIHKRFNYTPASVNLPDLPPQSFGGSGVEYDHMDEEHQFDAQEENYQIEDESVSDSEYSDDENSEENEVKEGEEAWERDQKAGSTPPPPPPPPHSSSTNIETKASTGKELTYDPKIHLKRIEISKQIMYSGLKNHQIDIDVLTEEAVNVLDISKDEDFEYVHHDSLLRWIQSKKLLFKDEKERSAVLPVPSEESTIKKEQTLNRHLSGFTPSQITAIQSPSLNQPVQVTTDVRNTKEKRELFPTKNETLHSMHDRNATMYTLSAIKDVTTKAAEREAVRLGLDPSELKQHSNNNSDRVHGTAAEAVAHAAATLYEEENDDEKINDIGDNWNEKFLQTYEMPILKHHDAMIKGKKLYDLNQKMIRLASIAARTIVDEFALPAKLKKIKPLEWYDDINDDDDGIQSSSMESKVHRKNVATTNDLIMDMEDGLENDILYSYQGLLIRVVGVNKALMDATTSRKVTGHEVRSSNSFREASTAIKQDMITMKQTQLNSEGFTMEASSIHIPEVHTTNAYIVDYSGFRLLVTTIPPIDEEYTIRYGRINPHDPNSDFIDNNITMKRLMNEISKELNLKQHRIIAGGAAKAISLSSELQGHECSDGRFYAVNMSRLMPPDLPNGGSDVITKLLRSELIQHYSSSVSSDAFSSIIHSPQNDASVALLNDSETNDVDVGNVSKYLRNVLIDEFVAKLDTLSIFPYESYTLTKAIHMHGINVRHLGLMLNKTKLPHVYDLIMTEMIARTAKDILNENQRKQIVDAHRHVVQLVNDLAKQGRHLNDDAMSQLLEYNVAVTDDANGNVLDFFNLVLGSSTSTENNMFWSHVLVPRLAEKFNINITTTPISRDEEEAQKVEKLKKQKERTILGKEQGKEQDDVEEEKKESSKGKNASSTTSSASLSLSNLPIRLTRSTTNAKQLFHALQYHCGVRFVSSEHYEFDDLARPFTESSQLLEIYPKIKSYYNKSLEVNRVADAAEIYRDSNQLDIALVAFKLRAQRSKNQYSMSKTIEFTLANNNIGNIYRLMAKKQDEHDQIYVHPSGVTSSQRMRQEGLEYTKLALNAISHTHVITSRIYETRMKIFHDMKEYEQCAISFGFAIKAALSHYGDSGHHPLVAELHCLYGSLVSEHGGPENINLGKKNLEKAIKLACRIMGPKHPVLSTYTAEVGRIHLLNGDTFSALEHYQSALLLIQSSIGLHSLEASTMYYEMANIKQRHSHSLGQLEAEEGLALAEKALSIREQCAMIEVKEENGVANSGTMELEVQLSTDSKLFVVVSCFLFVICLV